MADEDLEKQIKSLAEKMDGLEESMSKVAGPYAQLVDYIERFQKISSSYFKMLGLYQRYGAISPDLLIPGVKDSISRDIVKVLFERDGQNISQITEKPEGYEGHVLEKDSPRTAQGAGGEGRRAVQRVSEIDGILAHGSLCGQVVRAARTGSRKEKRRAASPETGRHVAGRWSLMLTFLMYWHHA